ncbi:hypothetical protein I79_003553 [Cricetulus griseus]|uniref:Uncharacterized protein n=1 Tax=Cricetulus griseus TaxID=10029 RepID=G3H077_CRIGR|nr:hypothetical protein I79_003553 [Cricetulus griseus]
MVSQEEDSTKLYPPLCKRHYEKSVTNYNASMPKLLSFFKHHLWTLPTMAKRVK